MLVQLGSTQSPATDARFLILEPEVGKTYTLSGWMRTNNIVAEEPGAGAYFAASQFEFQGRPTQFSVDGKQIPEERYGNFTGTTDWQHFSHSFLCLPTTDWFEVVVGVYRASGSAWFSDLTFVEGTTPADFCDVVEYWQAAQWAHADSLKTQARSRPAAAILRDNLPGSRRGVGPTPIGTRLERNLSRRVSLHGAIGRSTAIQSQTFRLAGASLWRKFSLTCPAGRRIFSG